MKHSNVVWTIILGCVALVLLGETTLSILAFIVFGVFSIGVLSVMATYRTKDVRHKQQ